VPFDPQRGFDAETRAAIAAALPDCADADAFATIAKLETAARFILEARHKPQREPVAERDRYEVGAELLAEALAWLLNEVVRDPWPRPFLATFSAAVDKAAARHAVWKVRARARVGRGDPDLDLFYFMVFEAWIEAGGEIVAAETKKGKALVDYVCLVTAAIPGHALTDGGAHTVIRRFAPEYRNARQLAEKLRRRKMRRRRRGASKT
jgi:hypothetical protein